MPFVLRRCASPKGCTSRWIEDDASNTAPECSFPALPSMVRLTLQIKDHEKSETVHLCCATCLKDYVVAVESKMEGERTHGA